MLLSGDRVCACESVTAQLTLGVISKLTKISNSVCYGVIVMTLSFTLVCVHSRSGVIQLNNIHFELLQVADLS